MNARPMTDDVKQRLAAAKAARMNDPEWIEKERARNRERKKRLSPEQAEKKRMRDKEFRQTEQFKAWNRERNRRDRIAKAGGVEAIEARKRERAERAAARLAERQARRDERAKIREEKKRSPVSQYQAMTPEQRKEVNRRLAASRLERGVARMHSENLEDSYVKRQIQNKTRVAFKDIPQDLVELERIRIKTFRYINGRTKQKQQAHQ